MREWQATASTDTYGRRFHLDDCFSRPGLEQHDLDHAVLLDRLLNDGLLGPRWQTTHAERPFYDFGL